MTFLFLNIQADRDIVELLILNHANISQTDKLYRTPLEYAIRYNRKSIVKLLLHHQANANLNSRGTAPLHQVGLFLTKKCKHKKIYQLNFPQAAESGNYEIVRLLIAHKADINVLNSHRRTPLHYAAQRGHVNVIQLLLDHGANIHSIERSARETALHRAAATGSVHGVELLLQGNADIHALDYQRKTPLHKAAISGNVSTIDLLISRGSALWFKDKFGKTPRDCCVNTASRLAFDRAVASKRKKFIKFMKI